jgi:hypothetical protein
MMLILLLPPVSVIRLNDAHSVTVSHLCHTPQILNFISSPIQYRFSFFPSRLGIDNGKTKSVAEFRKHTWLKFMLGT